MSDSVETIYPSNATSLKASDLKGHSVKVSISSYEVKTFDRGQKIVLSFHGKEKTFVVNKTNAMIIASAYGSNPEGWVDNEIELYPDKTMFNKELVDCIRVRTPAPAAKSDIPF